MYYEQSQIKPCACPNCQKSLCYPKVFKVGKETRVDWICPLCGRKSKTGIVQEQVKK